MEWGQRKAEFARLTEQEGLTKAEANRVLSKIAISHRGNMYSVVQRTAFEVDKILLARKK